MCDRRGGWGDGRGTDSVDIDEVMMKGEDEKEE